MVDKWLRLTLYILGKTSHIDRSQIRLRALVSDYLECSRFRSPIGLSKTFTIQGISID